MRALISLTGHSFERSRGQGIVEKITSEKKTVPRTFPSGGSFRVPECLNLNHGTILVGCLLLGGFSPDPDIDIAAIVVVFFLFNKAK